MSKGTTILALTATQRRNNGGSAKWEGEVVPGTCVCACVEMGGGGADGVNGHTLRAHSLP